MKFLLLSLLFFTVHSFAVERFVRTDGGTWEQCDGTANVAYSASITNRACAVKHLFELLSPEDSANSVRISGGDIVNIMNNEDGSPAEYIMGRHGDYTDGGCNTSWSYSCVAAPIPSGTAQQPTIIRGGDSDTCTVKPTLYGVGRAKQILKVDGNEHIEISCLTLTDKSSCISASNFPDKSVVCDRTAPYDKPFADAGIFMRDANDIVLKDMDIKGLSKGVFAGRLNDITLERVNIHANSGVGWDGDINYLDGKGSANTGTILFKDSSITFNGCGLIYDPGSELHDTPHACAHQDYGGYGDGLGTGDTGGDWVFDNVKVMHNNSDGIDLLYHVLGGTVTVKNSHFEGNAGNQMKISGSSRIYNNIVIGSCAWNSRQPDHIGKYGETCRAQGNPLTFSMTHPDTSVAIVNNTIYSEGDCVISSGNRTNTSIDKQKLNVVNNLFYAKTDWWQNFENACMYYTEHHFPIKQIHNNIIHKPKGFGDPCNEFASNVPAGEFGSICTTSRGSYYNNDDHSVESNPQFQEVDFGVNYSSHDLKTLAAESNKPQPVSESSPAVDAGYEGSLSLIDVPSVDYFGEPRVGKPDIGAIEYKVKPKAPTILQVRQIN